MFSWEFCYRIGLLNENPMCSGKNTLWTKLSKLEERWEGGGGGGGAEAFPAPPPAVRYSTNSTS